MPVIITEEYVKLLIEQNAKMTTTISNMEQDIVKLNQTIAELNKRVAELTEQLNKNSKNSSKPPSSDGLKKPSVNKDRSLRGKSGKKQGGQEGHKGMNLMLSRDIDHFEQHMHSDCTGCPMRTRCLIQACIKEKRINADAEVRITLTEHQQILVPECPMHGGERKGEFPADIKAPIQYGKNLQALVVALNTVGSVSINRTHEILASVFNIPLSTGTIKNMVTRFSDRISSTCEKIRQVVAELDLINCDETGGRVDGHTGWIHDASNALYTYLTFSWKRGCIGMEEADVLPNFRGIIIHDCWSYKHTAYAVHICFVNCKA